MLTFINILILVIVAVILINEFFQARLGVPAMPSMPRVRQKMRALVTAKPGDTIIELGAGWGGLARQLARDNPQCRVIGYERSPVPFLVARVLSAVHPNLSIKRDNFFDVSLRDANIIVCYLTHSLMARLEPKFRAELHPGARVISSTFPLPNHPPTTTEIVPGQWDTTLFIYDI